MRPLTSYILLAVVALAWLMLASGCQRKGTPSLARADLHIDRADHHLERVEPKATGEVKGGITSARGELKEAKKGTGAAAVDFAKLEAEHKRVLDKFLVRVALTVDGFWNFLKWAVPLTLIAAFVAKSAGVATGSRLISGVGTALWAVATGGITLFKTFAGWIGAKAGGKKRVVLPAATANVAVAKAECDEARKEVLADSLKAVQGGTPNHAV